ncbi:hypothetical protein LEP3755_44350 [Leptolyngbya sp. NIES-3755]|nr:hypothetical protein LEP3755_44350 [Leptolyngbya sp. NIES-3755]
MRIFLSCQQSQVRHPVPAYSFWQTYFKAGIEEAGHTWTDDVEIDWAEGLVYSDPQALKQWRDRVWSRTIDIIRQQHQQQPIDLFLSYLFPKQVEPSAIRAIQDLGIPCVNFFCDNVRQLRQVPRSFYPFDLHWVPEYAALRLYQRAKLNYLHAPMPVWIAAEQRTWNHAEIDSVSFIGSYDIQRAALLNQVIKLGGEIELRGAGWSSEFTAKPLFQPKSRWQTLKNQWQFIAEQGASAWIRKLQSKSIPSIPSSTFSAWVKPQPDAEAYIEILQKSRITLGINRYPSFHYSFTQPHTYSRMRDIEAPMMGACYLTEWAEGLEHLYELGEEIEIYRTAEELVEKIQYLNADPAKRRTIRQKGQRRALSEHTIAKSLSKIQAYLGLTEQKFFVSLS